MTVPPLASPFIKTEPTNPSTTLLTSVPSSPSSTWVIVGASRGIGLEFVRQLLLRGHQVIAAVRDPATASQLWRIAAGGEGVHGQRPGRCVIEMCDVTEEGSLEVSCSIRE